MDIVTADFSKFSARELTIAVQLLEAYAESGADFLNGGLTVNFNRYSGKVFFADENGTVGVLDNAGTHIVQFFTCAACGLEATQEDALEEGKDFIKNGGYCSPQCGRKNS